MQLKKIAAVAAFMVAAPAFAAINSSTAPELFGVVWDEAHGSYTKDLGVNLDTFMASLSTGGTKFSVDVGSAYAQFTAADVNPNDGTKFGGTRWAIFAVANAGFGDVRYLTSTNLGEHPADMYAGDWINAVGAMDNLVQDINQTGTHLPPGDYAVNGESFNAKGTRGFFNEPVYFGSLGQWAGNVIGTSTKVYLQTDPSAGFDSFAVVDSNALNGEAKFDGHTFSYAVAAAPVPEPETYALMLAGLAAVGFVARRRRG